MMKVGSSCQAPEWDHRSQSEHKDPAGDDDMDVIIRRNGETLVVQGGRVAL